VTFVVQEIDTHFRQSRRSRLNSGVIHQGWRVLPDCRCTSTACLDAMRTWVDLYIARPFTPQKKLTVINAGVQDDHGATPGLFRPRSSRLGTYPVGKTLLSRSCLVRRWDTPAAFAQAQS
jgi:hypothetical protein